MFIDLERKFAVITKDKEADLVRDHQFREWIGWPELLRYRRVVLLAEASGGKTEEFRHQAV
jgi:hypothetical protein